LSYLSFEEEKQIRLEAECADSKYLPVYDAKQIVSLGFNNKAMTLLGFSKSNAAEMFSDLNSYMDFAIMNKSGDIRLVTDLSMEEQVMLTMIHLEHRHSTGEKDSLYVPGLGVFNLTQQITAVECGQAIGQRVISIVMRKLLFLQYLILEHKLFFCPA
jgi:hypothetical protein